MLAAPARRYRVPMPTNRAERERILVDLTSVPTAAGREHRVLRFIDTWLSQRTWLQAKRDPSGNVLITRTRDADSGDPPLLFTAHLDHPAFVVESVGAHGALELTFRGGVRDPYFQNARISVRPESGQRIPADLRTAAPADPLRRCTAQLEDPAAASGLAPGDVAVWDLPDAEIIDGELHAQACDDLAAAASALCALDEVGDSDTPAPVGLLLTRAEEVGFIGAIAACRDGLIPAGARLLALENSRAFAESPIGGGPIVRVGDRMSVFDPALTGACARLCEALEKERAGSEEPFRWQRRLMPGGACEATCFCAHDFSATCLCLPLGEYHNMGNLSEVERGEHGAARIARERIATADFHGLTDLLVACARAMGEPQDARAKMDELYQRAAFVLND